MPPSTKFTIRRATEPDAPHLAHINITAFEPTPFWRNLFPALDRRATYPLKLARTLTKLADSASHLLVAEDPATGAVVGYARWTVPGPPAPASSGPIALSPANQDLVTAFRQAGDGALPPGTNLAIHSRFWGDLERLKAKYLREGDFGAFFPVFFLGVASFFLFFLGVVVVSKVGDHANSKGLGEGAVLEFLATLPEAQGQGVASGLLRWGLERADARNARVYLEATEEGYPVYRKYGWRDLEVLELDFAGLGGRSERQRWVMMMRERRDPAGEQSRGLKD
ncbi:GNAT family N-acetyltransferase [Aspergillus fijiensis CBS 313.89]|uniref:Acyl-CoA N-acyltransferase n=1 Tax=Aspergillus fijiensis CBS 313.89 TaxID=1448319 RepID=A0A8G1S1Z5_9EURO|nr:acyl-CoA N-acyltransferase [Aspergillus fijiensis CBS 313.89]RAK82583.1 acyl-CoA N-acyltransferase [Aspergillus fijiensis CBS 313.89]